MIAAIIYFQSGEGFNGRLIVWNVDQLIIRLDVVTGVYTPLSWSGDSQFIAIGSIYNPGELNVYNVQNQQVVNTFDHTTDIYDIRWHPTNINQLGVGGLDRVFIINPFTSQEIMSLSNVSHQLTFSPDGSKLAATGKTQPAVFIFDTSTWTQVASAPENMGYNEKALSWVADGLIVVSATLTVTKWNPITQQQLANFSLASEVSTFYFWKPDGSRLFLFGNYPDETIRVADANTGQVLVEYPPSSTQSIPSLHPGQRR
jgi:WD40 repeat protein